MDRYLTPDDVCALVPGMSREILTQLRYRKIGPSYSKPSLKTVIYKESDIVAWIEATRVEARS